MTTAENAEKPVSAKKKAARKKAPSVKKTATPATETLPDPDELIHEQPDDVAVDDAPDPEVPDDAARAEDKRRKGIRAELEAIEHTRQNLQAQIDDLDERSARLLLELYPQSGESDTLTDAMRGYLESSKRDRQMRVSEPARLAALIDAAQKAPIDRAMMRRNTRGTARPRHPTKQVNREG